MLKVANILLVFLFLVSQVSAYMVHTYHHTYRGYYRPYQSYHNYYKPHYNPYIYKHNFSINSLNSHEKLYYDICVLYARGNAHYYECNRYLRRFR